jgi:hypothetical protein
MTNYTSFPSWRCHTGFTIQFTEHEYSWSPDTPAQRKYLATSDYCKNATRVYIGKQHIWMAVEDFKKFCAQ